MDTHRLIFGMTKTFFFWLLSADPGRLPAAADVGLAPSAEAEPLLRSAEAGRGPADAMRAAETEVSGYTPDCGPGLGLAEAVCKLPLPPPLSFCRFGAAADGLGGSPESAAPFSDAVRRLSG